MYYSIDQIFEMLSWRNSEELQRIGISEAKKIKNLSIFLQPLENKNAWENCAKILISKSDEELEIYLYALMEWLQDLNWPGAQLIYSRLVCVNKSIILPICKWSYDKAVLMKDTPWICVLEELLEDINARSDSIGDGSVDSE